MKIQKCLICWGCIIGILTILFTFCCETKKPAEPENEYSDNMMQQTTVQEQVAPNDSLTKLRNEIALLAKGIALTLKHTEFSTDLAQKFSQAKDKVLDLKTYLTNLPPSSFGMIASNMDRDGATVDEIVPETPYPLELYLSLKSQNWDGEQAPVVVYDPLIDELELKTVPGFTTSAQEISLNAWEEPENM